MQCGWYKEVRVKDLDSHAVKALLVSRALLVKIKRDLEVKFVDPKEPWACYWPSTLQKVKKRRSLCRTNDPTLRIRRDRLDGPNLEVRRQNVARLSL